MAATDPWWPQKVNLLKNMMADIIPALRAGNLQQNFLPTTYACYDNFDIWLAPVEETILVFQYDPANVYMSGDGGVCLFSRAIRGFSQANMVGQWVWEWPVRPPLSPIITPDTCLSYQQKGRSIT